MRKFLSFIFGLLLSHPSLMAQYSTDWIRPSGDFQKTGVMVARDKLDNVAVTGFWTAYNIFTRRYDKFGNQQWENTSTSGVASNYEKAVWINCDSNNNVIVTGYRYTIGAYHFPNALIVIKYDPAGTLLWKSTIPMTFFVNHITSFNMRSEVDNDGNIYVGTVAISPSGFVLMKMDPAGNILFINNDNSNPVAIFSSMRLSGNHVVMCGGVPVTNNAIAMCWNTSGTVAWNAVFSGNSGVDIDLDESNNTYLLTSLDNQVNPTSQQDIMIYKLDPSGVQTAVNSYDFGGSDFPTRFIYAGGKISTIGYSSIAAGYFDWVTFQVNTGGTKLWDTRYNETTINDEYPYGLTARSNGEVFVTGRGGPNHTIAGSNYLRMITLKYDNTGTRKWVDSVNVFYGWGRAITLAADNSLYVVSDGYTTAFHFLDHNGAPPAAIPASLNVSNISSTSATFTWSSVPGAYLYHLRYKESTATGWTVKSTNSTTLLVTGLTDNTTYQYACEAVNEGGPSGYSTTQSFTTGTALPVTGMELFPMRQGTTVLLTWRTEAEINSANFEIQRSSDGIYFIPVGTMSAAGNSNSTLWYRFTDPSVPRTRIYYRLKMVDTDMRFTMSAVRSVGAANQSDGISLYPNPARSSVSLVLPEAASGSMSWRIISLPGQLQQQGLISNGTNMVVINTGKLTRGLYLLQVTRGDQVMYSEKLFIQ